MTARIAVTLVVAVATLGCAPALPQAPALLPGIPSEGGKCRVAASQSSPLLTEWSAAEKANLEVMLRSGAVVVAYSGCSMRLLPECRVPGAYRWLRTTPSRDLLEINNEDELYAKLPLGAASLEAELSRAGNLSVETTVSGQIKLEGASVRDVPLVGECARATHVMTALSLGAFSLTAGGAVSGKASASAMSVRAGGGASRELKLLRGAGKAESCSQSSDESPHADCASPLEAFLTPLPGRGEEEGPPDTLRVDVVSENPGARWEVIVDERPVCSTPCSQWLRPERPFMLRSGHSRVVVPNLLAQAGERRVMLRAKATNWGLLAGGITLTATGGGAALMGAMLTAMGGAVDRPEMAKGGLITMGVGAAMLGGGIWMILGSQSRARIVPYRVLAGPGFVAGSF